MAEQSRRLVVIGGGRGSSLVALAAQKDFASIEVLVATTDTGRSTGVARSLLPAMPAPGDLRNGLATLASDDRNLASRLLQYRFQSHEHPALDGMALGNLLLVALTDLLGDLNQASDLLNQQLQTQASVRPIATVAAQLCADLEDGSQRVGELAVRGLHKAPIARLYLDHEAPANPAALDAITAADLVALGPGSFYTSVLASSLFAGVREALANTKAKVVWISNTTTQPGQTDGMNLAAHVSAAVKTLGDGVIDYALLNDSPDLDPATIAGYAAQGLHLLRPDEANVATITALGVTPIVGDFAERRTASAELWQKLDSICHEPSLLGKALSDLCEPTTPPTT